MVSRATELFRRTPCDETFAAKMPVISISGKLEGYGPAKDPHVSPQGCFSPRPACGERSPRSCAAGKGAHRALTLSEFAEAAPHPNPLPARAGRGSGSKRSLRLVAGGREQIAAAADGADHRGLGRIDLDLAA